MGARSSTPRIQWLEVLPLVNLSSDADQDYFADGMTEALTTDLGKISTLRVMSRTSAMQYKSSKKPLREIARELNVDALVEEEPWRGQGTTCEITRISFRRRLRSTFRLRAMRVKLVMLSPSRGR